jgi:hypothetical protein
MRSRGEYGTTENVVTDGSDGFVRRRVNHY